MTIVIGFSFPEFSILGADTRAISANPLEPVDDQHPKIHRTGYGLISGAGLSTVVDAVTNRFNANPPPTNRDAAAGIRAEVGALGLPPDHLGITLSCWLTTYTTGAEPNIQAGLAFIHRGYDYNPQAIPHNDFYVIHPAGMSDDLQAALDDRTRRLLETAILPRPPAERMSACIAVVHALIRFVSERNAIHARHHRPSERRG